MPRNAECHADRLTDAWWTQWTVVDAHDCHVWQGTRCKQGYGRLWFNGRSGRPAHRVRFELAFGPVPDGAVVCHACDNRGCVNLAHLFLGSQKDNLRDMFAKGRGRPRGRAPGALEQDVLTLFAVHPPMTLRRIAATLRASSATVSRILKAHGVNTQRRRTTVAPRILALVNSYAGVKEAYGLHHIRTPVTVAGWRHVTGAPAWPAHHDGPSCEWPGLRTPDEPVTAHSTGTQPSRQWRGAAVRPVEAR